MTDLRSFTPREIVSELDRYIVGQRDAKRAVAIALRNRWRRQQVPEELREEIAPKNIIMIGPTGVGKTEIARRLARLAQAPFIKVEASKFTEVGYVGRDVESILRDLTVVGPSMWAGEIFYIANPRDFRICNVVVDDLTTAGNAIIYEVWDPGTFNFTIHNCILYSHSVPAPGNIGIIFYQWALGETAPTIYFDLKNRNESGR